jgi:integrase
VAAYDRLIALWVANGRRPLNPSADGPTVNELIVAYFPHVEAYYRHPDGRPTTEVGNIRRALARLRRFAGELSAAAFDSLALEALRNRMVAEGLARTRINKDVSRVRALFRWAAGRRLVGVEAYQLLLTVPGLRAGRSEARETEPVRPAPPDHVEAAKGFLSRVVRAMVEVQELTVMRPQEVCALRGCDLDTTGAVWLYRPAHHKNRWRGKDRVVCIGPRAQAVLRPFLRADPSEHLFRPCDAAVPPENPMRRPRPSRAAKGGRRRPGECYRTSSYGHAVRTACRKAGVPVWSPNRLRHAGGTGVRRRYGLEAAQVVLGHSKADVTQVYAERDLALAERVALEVG